MKTLHLICNAHIDPVWMWDWDEGAATAIATFRQAAILADEYDYIFCHNEALLYEYIEEYVPELFEKIKELVKKGKWKITGGWYLQPDCNLPSGEAFVRQIELGRKYFADKFGARPTVATNFDSFGHSVGLVQILRKCGYDGYVCCRPMSWDKAMVTLPDTEFIWKGKDGSEVKVSRIDDISLYCSGLGTAKADIERKSAIYENKDVGVALWGVGNHGGNPSRKDLEDIDGMIKTSSVEIKHSSPEDYFAEQKFEKIYDRSMQPCLVGCYSSLSAVKRKNAELETALFETEKITAYAILNGYIKSINESEFVEAQKALAKFEFHDLLSGTVCEKAENTSLKTADYGLTLLKKAYDRAFFACLEHENAAGEGEFPLFVFNSLPYNRKAVVEAEFLTLNPIVSDTEQYSVTVIQNGKRVKSQVIKEGANINYDRRKRVAALCDLPAFSIARLDVKIDVTPKKSFDKTDGDVTIRDDIKIVTIGKKDGLLDEFVFDGKNLIGGKAFMPVEFDDYPDPWGWGMDRIGKNPVNAVLSECKKGVFGGDKNVNLIEDGDVLSEVESFFETESGFVRVAYKIYKGLPYSDVNVKVLRSEKAKALKLRIPIALKGRFIGQIPYAVDEFERDGKEITAQRFVAIEDGENALYIANDGTYGYSCDGDDLYITLIRGIAYCAHPIDDRPLIADDRYIPFAENGEREFNFRIGYCKKSELENAALGFVSKRDALNYYPRGEKKADKSFALSTKNISLSSCRVIDGKYELRLFNGSDGENLCEISCGEIKKSFSFGKYEVKTVVFDGRDFTEKQIWE